MKRLFRRFKFMMGRHPPSFLGTQKTWLKNPSDVVETRSMAPFSNKADTSASMTAALTGSLMSVKERGVGREIGGARVKGTRYPSRIRCTDDARGNLSTQVDKNPRRRPPTIGGDEFVDDGVGGNDEAAVASRSERDDGDDGGGGARESVDEMFFDDGGGGGVGKRHFLRSERPPRAPRPREFPLFGGR